MWKATRLTTSNVDDPYDVVVTTLWQADEIFTKFGGKSVKPRLSAIHNQ